MNKGLTAEEIRMLPVTIDLVTAGRAFGIGRTKAYQLACTGTFPCRVMRVGHNYRVSTAELLTVLGLPVQGPAVSADQPRCAGQSPHKEEA